MKIQELNGNLLDFPSCDVIIHNCNCHNTMGAGIALQIAKRYPQAEISDRAAFENGLAKLGNHSAAKVKHNDEWKIIINCYAQFDCGTKDREFNYEAFVTCMEKIRNNEAFKGLTLGFPHGIGCGLAGGNWTITRTIIEETFKNSHNIVIVKYKE